VEKLLKILKRAVVLEDWLIGLAGKLLEKLRRPKRGFIQASRSRDEGFFPQL
jgi:hypothetical protein